MTFSGMHSVKYDNLTEHPRTMNVMARMNIYQEIFLATAYRQFASLQVTRLHHVTCSCLKVICIVPRKAFSKPATFCAEGVPASFLLYLLCFRSSWRTGLLYLWDHVVIVWILAQWTPFGGFLRI